MKIIDYINSIAYKIRNAMNILDSKKRRIERLNCTIKTCTNCRLSETRTNAIRGEGDLDSRLMLIAQAPGINEDREGKMFIGPSGRILDELLSNAGVSRRDIYITNLIKCMLPNYRKPKQDEIDLCSPYLVEEIDIIDPDILVPLGYYALKFLLSMYGSQEIAKADLSSITAKLIIADGKKIFPLRHPVTLLYNKDLREEMAKNYRMLKTLQSQCKWYPVCPVRRYYEMGKIERKWVELYCKGNWESCIRYQMEEKGEYHPDWMLPDGTIDKRLKNY